MRSIRIAMMRVAYNIIKLVDKRWWLFEYNVNSKKQQNNRFSFHSFLLAITQWIFFFFFGVSGFVRSLVRHTGLLTQNESQRTDCKDYLNYFIRIHFRKPNGEKGMRRRWQLTNFIFHLQHSQTRPRIVWAVSTAGTTHTHNTLFRRNDCSARQRIHTMWMK